MGDGDSWACMGLPEAWAEVSPSNVWPLINDGISTELEICM